MRVTTLGPASESCYTVLSCGVWFTSGPVSKLHPCCSRCQALPPLQGRVTLAAGWTHFHISFVPIMDTWAASTCCCVTNARVNIAAQMSLPALASVLGVPVPKGAAEHRVVVPLLSRGASVLSHGGSVPLCSRAVHRGAGPGILFKSGMKEVHVSVYRIKKSQG